MTSFKTFSLQHAEQRKERKQSSKKTKTEPDLFAALVKPDTSALIHFQAGLSLPGLTPQEPGRCSPPHQSWDSLAETAPALLAVAPCFPLCWAGGQGAQAAPLAAGWKALLQSCLDTARVLRHREGEAGMGKEARGQGERAEAGNCQEGS